MRERAHTHYTHLWAVTEHVAAGVVELVVQRNGLPIHVLKMCVCVCVCVCVGRSVDVVCLCERGRVHGYECMPGVCASCVRACAQVSVHVGVLVCVCEHA